MTVAPRTRFYASRSAIHWQEPAVTKQPCTSGSCMRCRAKLSRQVPLRTNGIQRYVLASASERDFQPASVHGACTLGLGDSDFSRGDNARPSHIGDSNCNSHRGSQVLQQISQCLLRPLPSVSAARSYRRILQSEFCLLILDASHGAHMSRYSRRYAPD